VSEGLARATLVLGGARSGKSAFAEKLAEAASPSRIYLATGTAGDGEMAARIAHHRARRGAGWRTVEEPLDLAGALAKADHERVPVIVDCLTLWVTNLMLGGHDVDTATQKLCDTLAGLEGPAIIVSNEVGLGIVPDNAMAREFRDHAGRVNQRVAAAADRVYFIAAGLPLKMKG
jgi:Adenosyl cobinamide kinase/adenosyl cobinamide phosphate guanylyltransferase